MVNENEEIIDAQHSHQYLCFSLMSEYYATPINAVREIIEVPSITEVPMVPNFLKGVINLRGSVVSVVDLAAWFGRGETPMVKKTCVIIVEIQESADRKKAIGIVVEGVREVISIKLNEVYDTPQIGASIDPYFVDGIIKHNGQILMVLNIERTVEALSISLKKKLEKEVVVNE